MKHTNAISRLQRLDEIIGILRATDSTTTQHLSVELNVSQRTLMRDLALLREQGYPIESDVGRGGGIRLNRHYGIGRLMLNYKEVVDLLLSITVMERLGSPILLRNLKSVRNKLAMSFPESYRYKLQRLRKRILVSDSASIEVLGSYPAEFKSPHQDCIHEAFFEQKNLHIEYRDGSGNATKRSIEIHYLFLNFPVWYAFAWDHLREAPRHFRIDRMTKAIIEKQSFHLKKPEVFMEEVSNMSETI